MLPAPKPAIVRSEVRYAPLARFDARDHVGLRPVHQLIGEALHAVGERAGLRRLQGQTLGDLTVPDQLDDPGHHPYELVVFAPQLGEQPDFVLRHELQAVEVIAELVQLAQGSGERRLLGYQKGGGHAVELRGRVVLELAVGGDLALQRHHFLRVALDPRQHLEADRADRDQ